MEYTCDKLKRIRLEKGLTQKALSAKCGILEPNIRKYESGKQNPKKETLLKLADGLGVNITDLLSDSELASMQLQEKVDLLFNNINELIQEENLLINNYRLLNTSGREEAFKRVEELTEIPKYTKQEDE